MVSLTGKTIPGQFPDFLSVTFHEWPHSQLPRRQAEHQGRADGVNLAELPSIASEALEE